jgi:Zn-dependent M28 family amino/carboxypeptidase
VLDEKGNVAYVDENWDLKDDRDLQALLAALGPKLDDAERADAEEAIDRFSPEEYARDLKTLSSDEYEGRGIGTRAERKTVEYLAGELAKAGFAPGHGESFMQPVPLVSIVQDEPPKLSLGDQSLAALDDFVARTHRQQKAIDASGELLFVGYGCTAPEFKWDDFKGVDCTGKVLVVLINDPSPADGRFGGKAMTYYGRWTYKYEEAARRKAAGVLIVHETEPAAYPWEVVRNSWGGAQFDVTREDAGASCCAFEGWITRDVAAALVEKAGKKLDVLKAEAAREDFRPVPLGITAKCSIRQTTTPIASNNVAGILPGADPRRSNEFLVLTAHWDHFGVDPKKNGDNIFNGAVDNASGCAGVLALARALARGTRPARSVMALFVTAEERGLLGSQYYADHPLVPLEKTLAEINLDGMNVHGRTRDIAVVGMGQSTLEDLLAEAAKAQGRVLVADPEPEKGFFYRSDQLNFARKGVPALYVDPGIDFVGQPAGYGESLRKQYTAERYHKPSDEFDPKWVFTGAIEDLESLCSVSLHVLNDAAWPAWRETSEFRKLRPAAGQ